MYYLRSYPLSLLTAAAICYLSFFTPPQTDMDGIPNIDKIVHICMYGDCPPCYGSNTCSGTLHPPGARNRRMHCSPCPYERNN